MPEHKIDIPKVQSSSSWLFGSGKEDPTVCNGVKLSSFNYKTCDLQMDNHKQLRKNGLLMHLKSMDGVLAGTESMGNSVSCAEVVSAAYLSLHKYYLCYKEKYGYLYHHDWEFFETTKVLYAHLYLINNVFCLSYLTLPQFNDWMLTTKFSPTKCH